METHYQVPMHTISNHSYDYDAPAGLLEYPDLRLVIECESLNPSAYLTVRIGGAMAVISAPGRVVLGHMRSDRPAIVSCHAEVVGRGRFAARVISFSLGEDIPEIY